MLGMQPSPVPSLFRMMQSPLLRFQPLPGQLWLCGGGGGRGLQRSRTGLIFGTAGSYALPTAPSHALRSCGNKDRPTMCESLQSPAHQIGRKVTMRHAPPHIRTKGNALRRIASQHDQTNALEHSSAFQTHCARATVSPRGAPSSPQEAAGNNPATQPGLLCNSP